MIDVKALVQTFDVYLAYFLLGSGILFSILTRFPQLRKFSQFIKIVRMKSSQESTHNTISPLHALYTAMSTSLGMGNIISPAVAISIGGPGALFWMVVYAFFGCVTKYLEVIFAVKYKRHAADGTIIGGPTGYLYHVHPWLANWYGFLTIFLFSAWSGLQAKTLAGIYLHHGIAEYQTGAVLALFVFFMLMSGTKTIGNFASRTVPLLFMFYISIAFYILLMDTSALLHAISSIFAHAFHPTAAIGGFVGASAVTGLRQGILKGAFTTEVGIGTAAIPHSYSSTREPVQQGILGMYSIFMNTFLCVISGLVTLITGVWTHPTGGNDLAFHAFQKAIPGLNPIAFTMTITLCIIGATLGNSFNGSKSFSFFTNNRWMTWYYCAITLLIFLGALGDAPTLWSLTDLILPLVALPNIIGLLILARRNHSDLVA